MNDWSHKDNVKEMIKNHMPHDVICSGQPWCTRLSLLTSSACWLWFNTTHEAHYLHYNTSLILCRYHNCMSRDGSPAVKSAVCVKSCEVSEKTKRMSWSVPCALRAVSNDSMLQAQWSTHTHTHTYRFLSGCEEEENAPRNLLNLTTPLSYMNFTLLLHKY